MSEKYFYDSFIESSLRRTAKCIRMLVILNGGGIHKVSELAHSLGTNPRNIIEYKSELEDAGYMIESIPGRYGGYRLNKDSVFPAVKLTEDEKHALQSGAEYISKRPDFMEKDVYNRAFGKIMSSVIIPNQQDDFFMFIERFKLSMPKEELIKRYDFIRDSIKNKMEVKALYLSLKNEEYECTFHPYEMYTYNNGWYIIGWSQNADAVRFYKLDRLITFENTSKKFCVRRAYKRGDYFDEAGHIKAREWYHIVFEVTGRHAVLAKEYVYGENQVITVNGNTTKVEVDMQNKEIITEFILGMGTNVKVYEPQWLIDDIKRICSEMAEKF